MISEESSQGNEGRLTRGGRPNQQKRLFGGDQNSRGSSEREILGGGKKKETKNKSTVSQYAGLEGSMQEARRLLKCRGPSKGSPGEDGCVGVKKMRAKKKRCR